MSWLRLDDGFTKHPKFAGWTPAQKWALLELFEYCARYETAGVIPADLSILPRSTTSSLLARAEAATWLDRRPDGALVVHDWEVYNPPNSGLDEAVIAYITEHPNATANEVAREVRGSRKRILAAVSRFRSGSESGSESVPKPVPNQSPIGSEVVTRAGARARAHGPRPVPSVPNTETEPEPEPVATDDGSRGTGAGAGADDEIERLDPRAELERVAAEGTS